ncbi:hypothetical protein, partial [Burkholderia multivorans]
LGFRFARHTLSLGACYALNTKFLTGPDEPAKLPRRQFPAIRRGQTSGPNSPSSMAPALFDASPADLTGNRQLAEVQPRHFNLAAHRFR